MAKFFFLKSRARARAAGTSMPLSCAYLASSLQNAGHEVTGIMNAQLEEFSFPDLKRHLLLKKPDVVGISSLTAEASFTHIVAQFVREALPQALVLLGGHYPSGDPERALADPAVSYTLSGEGEEAIVEFARRLEEGRDLAETPGLVSRRGSSLQFTPPLPLLQNLDQRPFPSWDLIDFERYRHYSPPGGASCSKKRYAILFTSRGCPYQCVYCHDLHGKKFRARSVENTLEEIRLLYQKYGVREFHIMDDIFNFDLNRAKEILRGALREKLEAPFYFGNGLRPEWIDEPFLDLLKDLGTEWLSFGIDSGSARIQRLCRRNLNLAKAREVIALSRKKGIFTKGNFIIGFPTETESEVEETIHWMTSSDLDAIYLSYLTPIPGSHFGREKKEEAAQEELMYDGHTFMLITKNFSSVSNEKLRRLRLKAFLQFYLSRKRLFQKNLKHALWSLLHLINFLPVLLHRPKPSSLTFLPTPSPSAPASLSGGK